MTVRFIRTARFAPGKGAEAHDLSMRLQKHFKEHYDLEVSWGYQWAGPTGTIYWFADYDSMGHWEESSMAMVGDEGLSNLMQEGASIWVGGAHDTIVRLE